MSSPSATVQYFLLAVLICALVATGLGFFSTNTDLVPTQVEVSKSSPGEQQRLRLQDPGLNPEEAEALPRWLVGLIGGFVVLQVLPLLMAYSRSQRLLDRQQIRVISFLCDTPMYLGLLGSLVGVCITQFITGSLAAPLAYITTITGILFYLFGRFTIVLALPDQDSSSLNQ